MARQWFSCIDGHTAGMPVRMVTSGAPALSGATMAERWRHFMEEFDWVRKALMLEPRGHGHMSGTILYPPLSEEFDCSLLFIERRAASPWVAMPPSVLSPSLSKMAW